MTVCFTIEATTRSRSMADSQRESRKEKQCLHLFPSVINSTFEWHSCVKEPSGKCESQLMSFTIVNFVYIFLTIVKAFYHRKLSSVTSTTRRENKTNSTNKTGYKIKGGEGGRASRPYSLVPTQSQSRQRHERYYYRYFIVSENGTELYVHHIKYANTSFKMVQLKKLHSRIQVQLSLF